MKIYVLSSILLACSVSGFTLDQAFQSGVDAIPDGLSSMTQGIEPSAESFSNELSWFNEFGSKLTMGDDSDKPVPLNILEPSSESLEDTRKNLSDKVFFYLHTRDTQNNPEMLYVNDHDTLEQSHFDSKKPIIFITHGWTTSRFSPSCVIVREAALRHGDYNVIVVDWFEISKESYLAAVIQVGTIGKFIASMVDFLKVGGQNVSRLTMVGHSLGAHVIGLAGYYAKSKVDYVVGLDPAYPLFIFADASRRLSTESAEYVVAIHTNAGLDGYLTPIAHWDIYANDGTTQPGCGTDISCSHGRSFQYFAESINSEVGFWALQCGTSLEFKTGLCNSHPQVRLIGIEPNVNVTGVYYFKTSSSSPFALGRNN